jgi:hypothetical protein
MPWIVSPEALLMISGMFVEFGFHAETHVPYLRTALGALLDAMLAEVDRHPGVRLTIVRKKMSAISAGMAPRERVLLSRHDPMRRVGGRHVRLGKLPGMETASDARHMGLQTFKASLHVLAYHLLDATENAEGRLRFRRSAPFPSSSY